MARGGKQPGAGRPKGSKNPETIEKERVLRALREKVMKSADVLYRAQMTLALGQTYLYKVSARDKKAILITDAETIEHFLQTKGEEDSLFEEGAYYFLTTKEPDNKAIDSLLDRTFGKATQPISNDPENPFTPDDIRTLLGTLNSQEQEEFYSILDKYVTLAERRRSLGEVSETPTKQPRPNKRKVQRKADNISEAI